MAAKCERQFETVLETTFDWGGFRMDVSVAKGVLEDVNIEADGLRAEMGRLEGELLDCPFKGTAMARRVRGMIGRDGHGLLEDLVEWFKGQALC